MDGRIDTVLRIIDSDIQRGDVSRLSIPALAREVGMCTRYLQLYFKAVTGEPIGHYIARLKAERALCLLKHSDMKMQDIAYAVGLQNPSALNNILRKSHGKTPQQVRACLRGMRPRPAAENLDYRIEHLRAVPVLSLSYIGSYDTYGSELFEEDSWTLLYDHAEAAGVLPETPDYWGIALDDADITDPERCRFYACISVTALPETEKGRIKAMKIPGGRYAVYTHRGDYSLLEDFYSVVQCQLKFRLGSGLILERYLNSPSEVSADELLTEVWFPIE